MSSRPRGRPRKGDTRMDAALDAMDQYKFNPILVRRTVEELLNVYGSEGWFFIEECAYMLLIETLLEKGKEEPESEDKGNDTLTVTPQADIVASCSNMQMSEIPASCSSTPENKVHDPSPLCIQGHDPTPLCIQGHEPTLLIKEALESVTPAKEAHGPTPLCIEGQDPPLLIKEAVESSTPGKKDHDPASLSNIHDHTSPPDESVVKLCLPPPAEDKGRTSEDVDMEENIQTKQTNTSSDKQEAAPLPPYKLISPPPMDAAFSHLNRRPFHGWIDDDDDEECEMVELTPEPLPESLRRMLNLVDGFSAAEKKKRKSRWDEKPCDGT